VAQHHPPRGHRLLAEVGLPVAARGRSLDLANDDLDESVEEVVLAPDMSV